MCCIVALMGLIGPRVAFLYAWAFTEEVNPAIPSIWMKLLGVVFLPWTALFYAIAWAPIQGVSGFGVFFVLLGILFDIASYGSGAYSRR